MTPSAPASLDREILGDDGAAFERFIGDVEPRLRRALIGAVGTDRVDDAVGEALAYAWENWSTVSLFEHPVSDLYRAVRSTVLRRKTPSLRSMIVSGSPETESRLPHALMALPPLEREAVWLARGCGWNQDEIGEALDLAPSSASASVANGMHALRLELGTDRVAAHVRVEEQIWNLADAEFAHTTPARFAPKPPKTSQWWFAVVLALVVIGVVISAQLGRFETAEPPADDDRPPVPAIVIDAAELDVPFQIRSDLSALRTLTRGDDALAIGSGEGWLTSDRGMSWQRLGLDWWPYGCPDGSQTSVLHQDRFAVLGMSSGPRVSDGVTKSVFISADGLSWDELRLPATPDTLDETACGIESDGERLVVSRAAGSQVELLIHAPGSSAANPFRRVRPSGASSTRVGPSITSFHNPAAIDLRQHDGQWVAAACVLNTSWFRAVQPPCLLEVWDVTAAVEAGEDVAARRVSDQSQRLATTPDGIWLLGIESSVTDMQPFSFPDVSAFEADVDIEIMDPGVSSGRPWASLVSDVSDPSFDPADWALPTGLSADIELLVAGGATFAQVTRRSAPDGGEQAVDWLQYRSNAWIEVEPIAPERWSRADAASSFTMQRWTALAGVLGWSSGGLVSTVAVDREPLIALEDPSALHATADLGHVRLGLLGSDGLLYQLDADADWRALDIDAAFGVPIGRLRCLGQASDAFYVLATFATSQREVLYVSNDGLAWTGYREGLDEARACADVDG